MTMYFNIICIYIYICFSCKCDIMKQISLKPRERERGLPQDECLLAVAATAF